MTVLPGPMQPQQATVDDSDGLPVPFSLAVWVGAVIACVGLLTLAGWHLGLVRLVQILPGAPPMQHNTALAFVLVGAGLFGRGRRMLRLAASLGGSAALIGAASLAQYLSGTDAGLDRLFIDTRQVLPEANVGRMAASSAACFVLLGTSLVLLRKVPLSAQAGTGVRLMSTAAGVLSAGAMLGHVTGLTAGTGWRLLQMAPQTAALVLTAAGVLLAITSGQPVDAGAAGVPISERRRTRLLPIAVTAGALVASVLAWLALSKHEDRLARERVMADARLVRQATEAALAERAGVVVRMARRWELMGSRTREQFELEAAVNQQSYPALRAIGWVGPELVVRWVHPVQGNEAALGIDVNAEPNRAATYARARDGWEVALSPPIALVQGGRGMLAVTSLEIEGRNAGYVYAAFDPAILLQRILGAVIPAQAVMVGAAGIPVFERDGPRLAWNASEHFELGGIRWRVTVWRGAEGPALPYVDLALAVSAVLSLLLGSAVHGRMLAFEQAGKAEAARQHAQQSRDALASSERAAAELARFLQSVVNGAIDPIFVKDWDGQYLLANSRTAEVLGVTVEGVRGRRDADFLPAEVAAAVTRADQKVMSEARPLLLEEVIPERGGERVYLSAKTPLLDPQGRVTGLIGVARDITDRIRAEAEVLRLNAELEGRVEERTRQLSDANSELDSFAHSVAHDLRAPLRSMRGFSQILLEDYGDTLDDAARGYLDRIAAGADRMDQLIQDLLTYARIGREELALAPVALDVVVAEAARQIETGLGKGEAKLHVDGPLPVVTAHRPVLVQVLANLLSNAAKFVPAGRPPGIRVWAEHRGHCVRLWIKDNGIGIAPEHGARIFGVFQRLHGVTEYPGTGVGLAIVKRGVERMGGAVGLESEPGQGSRFWVELDEARAG